MLDVVQLLVGDLVVPGINMKWLVLADVVSRTGGGQCSEWCPTDVVEWSRRVKRCRHDHQGNNGRGHLKHSFE